MRTLSGYTAFNEAMNVSSPKRRIEPCSCYHENPHEAIVINGEITVRVMEIRETSFVWGSKPSQKRSPVHRSEIFERSLAHTCAARDSLVPQTERVVMSKFPTAQRKIASRQSPKTQSKLGSRSFTSQQVSTDSVALKALVLF